MKFDSTFVRSESASKLQSRGRRLFRTVFVTLALVVLWLLVYSHFIFGQGTLLYKDVGVDSINIYYPRYVLISDYIRDEGIPSWSFRVGMGQNIFPSLSALVITPVVWLAKGAIAKALMYQHLVYVVLSGLLFALFLANRGLAFASCVLAALLLSFSGYMCMGSCWYFHARSAAAVRKRSDEHRRWFSRMAELLGSADDLRRTPLPCYVSSNICREHATSASSLWIIFECHPSSNALSLVQVSVLGISGRLLPNALLICSLRHYYTRNDRVFSLPRRRSSQSVAAWRHYLLIDRDSLLASSTISIADKSFPENLSHGFLGQLHGPISSWTAGETAAGYRLDCSSAGRVR